MNLMLLLFIIVVLTMALLGGGMAGGLVAWWHCHRHQEPASHEPVDARPSDEDLDHAAERWAAAHGRPSAAPLVAGKLKLGRQLIGRGQRRWPRW